MFYIQVFLSLLLALNRLARAASSKAQESRESVITPRHITAVAAVSLTFKYYSENNAFHLSHMAVAEKDVLASLKG